MKPSNHSRFECSKACLAAAVIYAAGIAAFSIWQYRRDLASFPDAGDLAIRHTANALILCAVALPLFILSYRAVRNPASATPAADDRQKEERARLDDLEAELQEALRDIGRFHAGAISREDRIIELKTEVNELRKRLNEPKRYHTENTTTSVQS